MLHKLLLLLCNFGLCAVLSDADAINVDWRAMFAANKLTEKQLKQAEKIRCAVDEAILQKLSSVIVLIDTVALPTCTLGNRHIHIFFSGAPGRQKEYKIKNLQTEIDRIVAKEKIEAGLTPGQVSTLARNEQVWRYQGFSRCGSGVNDVSRYIMVLV